MGNKNLAEEIAVEHIIQYADFTMEIAMESDLPFSNYEEKELYEYIMSSMYFLLTGFMITSETLKAVVGRKF